VSHTNERAAARQRLPQLANRRAVAVVMRRSLVWMVTLLIVIVSGGSAEARRHHRKVWVCRPGHSHVVAANKRAEVFEVNGYERRFDGCAYGQAHRYVLGQGEYGSSSGSGGSGDYTLAGTTVAFTEFFGEGALGNGGSSDWVAVVNLRNGKRLHRVRTATPPCEPKPYEGAIVESLRLKEDGAVAWIAADEQRHCSVPFNMYEVHALDSSGGRVLATGTDINPKSLALAGSTISWRQGGRPYSASLK
jgi:hypothetical protein